MENYLGHTMRTRQTVNKATTMNFDELKKEVIYSNNANRLFEISVELTELISSLHLDLVKAENIIMKAEVKGKISIVNTLQHIIDKRIDDARSNDKDTERKELLTNRQFRIAAEAILHKDTFERIKELSLMNYKKLKDIKTELRTNKME